MGFERMHLGYPATGRLDFLWEFHEFPREFLHVVRRVISLPDFRRSHVKEKRWLGSMHLRRRQSSRILGDLEATRLIEVAS